VEFFIRLLKSLREVTGSMNFLILKFVFSEAYHTGVNRYVCIALCLVQGELNGVVQRSLHVGALCRRPLPDRWSGL